jgi:AraC-like DNA-binding protein
VYREVAPHPALRAHVDRLWASADATADGAPSRILPDGCIDVIVDLDDDARVAVVGTMTRAVVLSPAAGRSVAVRFRPGGATPFLRTPAGELTDQSIAAGDVGLPWLPVDRFAELAELDAALAVLEELLLARLPSVAAPDPLVAHAVARLFAGGAPTIAALGEELGRSRQHLARMFGVHVGIAPKQLGRVARLQRAVAAVQRPGADLAAVAVETGYFDQAHMALDFRDLADLTPLEARAATGSILPIRSLFTPP